MNITPARVSFDLVRSLGSDHILVSSGPPPLDTSHLGLTLRHQGERSSWKLSVAAYDSDFDEIDSPILPFGNLYRDRDWLLASASYNHTF